ncbi:MAG: FecR domain-containing protein [Anaerolineales bacterium]|nr:FecR domain-containing protein [Anaerolineales bacterium]
MTTSLLRMAQQAGKNEQLLGSLVHAYSQGTGQSWSEIAAELAISSEQLARLALCSRPASGSDVAQIAQHAGMGQHQLTQFIRRAERPFSPPSTSRLSRTFANLPGRPFFAAGFAALIVLLLAAFAFAQPVGSDATLVVSAGDVTLTQVSRRFLVVPEEAQLTISAGSAILVNQGDVVDLPPGSEAQLRLADGSSVDLLAGTRLALSEILIDDNTYRVRLHMLAGRTVSRVVRLLGQGDTYEIRTPSSTASVRGTVFTVEVISDTESYFACDEGVVYVTMGDDAVELHPGEEVYAAIGRPLVVQPQNPVEEAAPTPQPPQAAPTAPPSATDTPDTPATTPPTTNTAPETPAATPPSGSDDENDGPPAAVPGNPPADPPGQGDPPDAGGDPPGQGDPPGGSPPPQVHGKPPPDPPGQGDPPDPGGPPPGQGDDDEDPGGGPPGQVPGNPPADPPGQGNPPGGGANPPGQGGTPPGQNKP